MKHVLVESNWVFACRAPHHLRIPEAVKLLEQSRNGKVHLHLPAICIREAADAIRRKCKPKAADLRRYLRTACSSGAITPQQADEAAIILDSYESTISQYLRQLDSELEALALEPGVEVFALDDAMLERAIALRSMIPDPLKPFDESILAAVLEKGRLLYEHAGRDVVFCTLDGDLRPWERGRKPGGPLVRLYDEAGIWVYGDFSLRWPERPTGWRRAP